MKTWRLVTSVFKNWNDHHDFGFLFNNILTVDLGRVVDGILRGSIVQRGGNSRNGSSAILFLIV